MNIPVINITPDPLRAARAWDAAMRETGFALISGHGIADALLNDIYRHAQAFFARPLAEKSKLTFPDKGRGQGYLPLRSEIVGSGRDSNARPDLCESLTFANPRFDRSAPDNALDARLYRANLWPGDMPGFRETVEAYFAAGRALALNLMRLHSPQSAILASVIFNAVIIIALIPLALRGVKYRPASGAADARLFAAARSGAGCVV